MAPVAGLALLRRENGVLNPSSSHLQTLSAMPLSLSITPVAQSISQQETLAMQLPVVNQPHSALALPVIPGWASILASATLAFALTAALYSLYSLDAHFRHRRQGRQDGILEISRPANPKFELANSLPSKPATY
jgi:hypothetical protein